MRTYARITRINEDTGEVDVQSPDGSIRKGTLFIPYPIPQYGPEHAVHNIGILFEAAAPGPAMEVGGSAAAPAGTVEHDPPGYGTESPASPTAPADEEAADGIKDR